MLRLRHAQRGATLIELVLSLAVGLAVMTALASLVGYGLGVNGKLITSSQMNEELSNVVTLMARDIKRAGYSGTTLAMVEDPAANPSQFSGSLNLSAFPGEVADSCITFSYDNNGNGVLDVAAGDNENFGYRLRNGTVEMRTLGLACEDEGWLPISSSDVTAITTLTFSLDQITSTGVTSTQVSLLLRATSAVDDDLTRQFETSFVVRNYD